MERDDIDIDAASLSRPQAELNDMALVCSPSLSAFSASMMNMNIHSAGKAGVQSRRGCNVMPCHVGAKLHAHWGQLSLENQIHKQSCLSQLKFITKTNGISEAGCAAKAGCTEEVS